MLWMFITLMVLLFVIIIISRLSIKINILLKEEKRFMLIEFHLFRICILRKKTNFLTDDDKNIWKIIEELNHISMIKTQQFISDMKSLYILFSRFLHKATIDRFIWKTEIDSKEALNTGVYTGMV